MAILRKVFAPLFWLINQLKPLPPQEPAPVIESDDVKIARIELEKKKIELGIIEARLKLASEVNESKDTTARLVMQMLAEHPKKLEELAELVAKKESEIYERLLTTSLLNIADKSELVKDPLAQSFIELAKKLYDAVKPDLESEVRTIVERITPELAAKLSLVAAELNRLGFIKWLDGPEGRQLLRLDISHILAEYMDASNHEARQRLTEELKQKRQERSKELDEQCFPSGGPPTAKGNGKPLTVIRGGGGT